MTQPATHLREQFGDIDVYLFDQLLRGRITQGMKVLDAGCGGARNLVYLMRAGFDIWAVDDDADAIARVRHLASDLAPRLPADRCRIELVEAMSLADASVDVVISSAVLHFARDDEHWLAMVHEMWRVLALGGVLFARLATTVAQPTLRPLGGRRYVMPDGHTRYLVDHELLLDVTRALGGSLLDPLKSTVVHAAVDGNLGPEKGRVANFVAAPGYESLAHRACVSEFGARRSLQSATPRCSEFASSHQRCSAPKAGATPAASSCSATLASAFSSTSTTGAPATTRISGAKASRDSRAEQRPLR
ncbi:MAG: methyltransferase domain-containing protein [Gemmatimonadaceae bacterium]